MRITAQEEYGLRIMILVARSGEAKSIADIASAEGMSHHNVAKICRVLRMGGFLNSAKGHTGGYELAQPAEEINIKTLMHHLGGTLYGEGFCDKFVGEMSICNHTSDCSIRSLWRVLQLGIDTVLQKLSLADLTGTEQQTAAACEK